jgi:hypothetical protein
MFGLGWRDSSKKSRSSNSSSTVAPLAAPFPSCEIPEALFTSEQLKSYLEQSRELGFGPIELLRIQLIDFFVTSGIALYDYHETRRWLEDPSDRCAWLWRPLRKNDVLPNGGLSRVFDYKYSSRLWDKIVPADVLAQVLEMHKKFGDDISFFVSSSENYRDGQHFLLVMPAGKFEFDGAEYCFIFAFWSTNPMSTFLESTPAA